MNANVTLLRQGGKRIDKLYGDPLSGRLAMHTMSNANGIYRELNLMAGDPMRKPESIARLYDPQLISIGNGSMLIRGFEVVDGRSVLQEWACQIT